MLLAAAGGYFGALPYYQIKQYKDQAAHRHQALVLAVKPFADSFLNDVAGDDTSTPDQSLKEIDQAQSYIKAAQDLINSDRKALTDFKPLPLLDKTYPGYSDIKKTAENEAKYVDTADGTLKNAQSVTVYAKELLTRTKDLETLEKKSDALTGTDPKVLATQVDGIATDMQGVLDKLTALQAPADIKTYHDKMVAAFGEIVTAIRDTAKGLRGLDLKAITEAGARVDKASKTMDEATKQFEKDYMTSSQMSKDIATLRDLEKQIKY